MAPSLSPRLLLAFAAPTEQGSFLLARASRSAPERTVDQKIGRLRIYNVVAGSLHLVQAIGFAIVLTMLSTQVTFAVTADYLAGPPGFPIPPERVELFDVNVGIGVVAFLALSAFFHFLISSPVFYGRYKAGLLQNRNYFRWVEYSLSSSIMIWLILQINGVTDVGALAAVFAANAAMILFGALQEKYEQPGSGGMLPFIFGSMVGLVPWIIVVVYFARAGSQSDAETPAFVIGIVISLFLFFNTFAVNQWLQYKQVGKWKDYLVGERAYITLSLVAKTALAWQVFSGAIIPVLTEG
ncbi:heliorhodopsin HeR [Microcella alkaliphila]|uniref:Heliorhodopsin n=1 Tax=Microcella alkaliphila TaxID=279828 RepID=A0A0U5B7D0_9MICO|nr:heliorhodopsin HeR [Microcella alkaliphila]BAU31764.1 uncharacterized protein MalAC0309_0898 [Microcella alkaliphila]